MSRIRFKGTTSASIPIPPTGKASLYYDGSDKGFKMKLDSGDVIALGMTERYIRDIFSTLVTDSQNINAVYNEAGTLLYFDLKPGTITDYYVDKISPSKITDATNGRFQGTILTTNNANTPIYSLDCSTSGIWMIELRITARQIGGLSGHSGDGATFKRTFRVKSFNSIVTIHDFQSDYTSRDNRALNVEVAVDAGRVVVVVNGLNSGNVLWNADLITSVNS